MASIKEAILWIACNDESGIEADLEELSSQITVLLVADIFGKEPEYIAKKVLMRREEMLEDR